MDNTNYNRFLLLSSVTVLSFAATQSSTALAFDNPDPEQIQQITANWVCKWCPYPDKPVSRGEVTAGAGYVTNDSFKHGDYTGLNEKGAYVIGDVDYAYKTNQGTYLDVKGSDLGLDSRGISVEGGNHGHISGVKNWNVTGAVNYKELPKLNLDTARTPYSGDAHLQLPAGWTTTGNTTQDMTQLADALHDVNIYTNRKTFSLDLNYQQDTAWSYTMGFQRDTKEGSRTAGLALGSSFAVARSAILAIPVDYVTDQGELGVNYTARKWHASASYQFSSFKNNEKSVRWDDAFTPLTDPSEGQAALEPDNNMWKISLNGAYRFTPFTSSSLLIAYGQLTQNDDFLPYTINSSVTPPSLPTSSLDGKINTLDGALNLQTKLTEQLRLEAKLFYNEQDNDTSRETYDYVIADTLQSGTARANFPYSFRKTEYRLLGRYQLPQHEFALGANREELDRTYQEVDTTTENTLKASYRSSVIKDIDFQVRGERSNRDGDKYEPVSEIIPPENDLLRKYNLADRNRDQLGVAVSYAPQPHWQLALYVDAAKDDYANSDLGLLESIQKDYSVALQYQLSEALSFNIDYSITTIESTQAGYDSLASVTWHAENDDQIDVIHLGVRYDVIPKKLAMGVEYSYAKSEGDIEVSTGDALPTLTSTRHTILLHGDYILDDKSSVMAFYRYEDYEEEDWAYDGVNPNTIPNVLTLGEVSPSYNIGWIGVALKYAF